MPLKITALTPRVAAQKKQEEIILSFEIYVDSSANLTEKMIEDNDIKIISYICTCDGKEVVCYKDGRTFAQSAREFYEKMGGGAEVSTSLIPEDRFTAEWEPVLKAGRDVLAVTISAQVSGTHHQACLAAEALMKKYPERKVLVADSANSSLGEGLLAVRAAKLRGMGGSIEACHKWIEDNRFKMNSYFTVADLKYLKKGGRISGAVAIAGTLLNIKPILKADGNGKISMCGKVRGRRKAIAELAGCYKKYAAFPEGQTAAICHCDCAVEAEELADMIRELGATDVTVEYYDIVSGAHVGPGTIALFFTGADRRGEHSAAKRTEAPAGKGATNPAN